MLIKSSSLTYNKMYVKRKCNVCTNKLINHFFYFQVPHLLNNEKPAFIENFGSFLSVKCDAIVEVFGLSLNPLAIIMECFENGPLDEYLAANKEKITQVAGGIEFKILIYEGAKVTKIVARENMYLMVIFSYS